MRQTLTVRGHFFSEIPNPSRLLRFPDGYLEASSELDHHPALLARGDVGRPRGPRPGQRVALERDRGDAGHGAGGRQLSGHDHVGGEGQGEESKKHHT